MRKIFDNLYTSWQRFLKTAKILEEDKKFEQDLSGVIRKILESLVPILGLQKQRLKGSERWNYGLIYGGKVIEIVKVRLKNMLGNRRRGYTFLKHFRLLESVFTGILSYFGNLEETREAQKWLKNVQKHRVKI